MKLVNSLLIGLCLTFGATSQANQFTLSPEASNTTQLEPIVLPAVNADQTFEVFAKKPRRDRRRDRRRPTLRVGGFAFNISRNSVLVEIIDREDGGTFVIKFLEGSLKGKYGNKWAKSDLAADHGCATFCVGDRTINITRENSEVKVIGIQNNGKYVLQFLSGTLQGKRGHSWADSDLVSTTKCDSNDLCVGDQVYNISRDNVLVRITAIQRDGRFVIRFLEGPLQNKLGNNWARTDLAVTYGCVRKFCVGDFALNKSRDYVKVQILAITSNGKFVLKFLQGPLRGKRGNNWSSEDLSRF